MLDHGTEELRALLLQACQVLDVGFWRNSSFGRLEARKDACGIEALGLLARATRPLRELDALLGCLRLGAIGGEIAVDRGELAVDLGKARLDRVQALLGVVGALLGDLVGRLQLPELVHALAVDGPFAFLERAFDALVLGQRLDALGVDLARFAVEVILLLSVVSREAGALGGEPGLLVGERPLFGGEACLAALCGGDALLLRLDGAVLGLDLLVEVALDLTLRALCGFGELGQVLVVGLPSGARKQRLRLVRAAPVDGLADVGDDAGDLVLSAQLGGAHALRLREDRRKERVEGEEHRRRHAGEEHHPQHGILENDARALQVGLDDVARRVDDDEGEDEQSDDGEQKLVAEPAPAQVGGASVAPIDGSRALQQ